MKKIYFILIIILISCESNTEIPLPANPVEKFALPRAIFSLIILPNPISPSDPTQTWTISETKGIGFDIQQITQKIYNQDTVLVRQKNFTQNEIIAIFDYVWIPPDTSITGTRNNDLSEPSGYWAETTIIGIDEKQNTVSTKHRLNIQ